MHGEWELYWIHPVLICIAIIALAFALFNFGNVKRILVGRPMRTRELYQPHTKLNWVIGLAILAADLYSSVAYGPEAGITELTRLGPGVKWMIRFRVKGKLWRAKAAINTFGAVVTALVAIIFAVTKFMGGAWIVLIVLPILIFCAVRIRKHYDQIADELRIDLDKVHPQKHDVLSVVLISGIHRVVVDTVSFAQSTNQDVIALYIGFDDESIQKMEQKWEAWGSPCRLVTIKSEYRSLLHPLSKFLRRLENFEGGKPDHIQLLVGQFVPKKWWHYTLHAQTSLLLRAWLLRHKDVVITVVPYHLKH